MKSPRSSIAIRRFVPAARRFVLTALGVMLMGLAFLATPQPANAIDVVTWNIARYPSLSLGFRQNYFRTVMSNISCDVLVVQELNDPAGRDSFHLNVLENTHPGEWSASPYIELDAFPQEGGAVFYRHDKVSIFNLISIPTGGPRDALLVGVRLNGYGSGTFFRVYSLHWKAGGGSGDQTIRATEGDMLRDHLNTVPATQPFIVGGDMNLTASTEQGFQKLVQFQIDDDGRCTDPLNLIGSWSSSSIAEWQSQSPCQAGCLSGFSGGGMDDRFDLWVHSQSMGDGEGIDYVTGSYEVYGNDGLHYNQDIDQGGNNSVPPGVATALRFASDHLPVIISIQVPAKILATSQIDIRAIQNASPASEILSVSNGAVAPADELTYDMVASAGFTTDLGTFIASTSSGVNDHLVVMDDTSVLGPQSGTITINNDDPDTTAKQVLISGMVLSHSEASLDSTEAKSGEIIVMGENFPGDFELGQVRVHNFGYDGSQALLSVDSAVITGGDGRFSVVGGTTPILLGDLGETYRIEFDEVGATPDSVYTATLTLNVSDESIPGSISHPPLVVTLVANPNADPTGVPGDVAAAIRFYPPHPNPMSRETLVRFDLPAPTSVRVAVFDLSGRRVASLASGAHGAGSHQLRWNGTDDAGARLRAGVYLVRFDSPAFGQTRRVALLR